MTGTCVLVSLTTFRDLGSTRDRQTDRQKETESQRKTDRQTDTETDKQTDRHRHRECYVYVCGMAGTCVLVSLSLRLEIYVPQEFEPQIAGARDTKKCLTITPRNYPTKRRNALKLIAASLCFLYSFVSIIFSVIVLINESGTCYLPVLSEPPLDRHTPVFTGKCFPGTGKKYSHRYQVQAETKRFV